MRYRAELIIPAGTLATSPATEAVALCYGTITEVEILFPAGQSGLTYVQIWQHERQILPTTPGEAFRGDDHLVTFNERITVHERPLVVELRGWAPDAMLDHTVYVAFTVLVEVAPSDAFGWFVPLPENF